VVTLPQEIPLKGTVELEIGYEGVIPLDATRLTRIGVPGEAARHNDWDQIGKGFTAVRGIGYVAWYPVATESASLSEGNSVFEALGRWKTREIASSMSLKLCETHDGESRAVIVVNADATTASANGGGVGTDTSSTDLPSSSCGDDYTFPSLGATAPAFAVAPYYVLSRPPIEIYYSSGHKSGADDYAFATDLATPFTAEWFGAPHGKTQVVELADPAAAPFESGSIQFTPLAHSDTRLAQMTVVHQLTHAAFPSPRPWIYEGLAHFAQAAYRENQSGRWAALDFMGLHRTALAQAEKAVAAGQKLNAAAEQSLINTSSEEFYRSKAMFVWWMLRDMLGEAPLKKALAGYRVDQDKEPSYIQKLLEAQTKRDLEWFFDDWVYRDRGLPDFKITSAIQRPTLGDASVVTITVENLGDAGAEVPITLRMESGESTKRLQVNAKSKASVRMEAATTLLEVVVNDGSVPESDMSNNAFRINATAK
jgi:hypothetical protein